MLQYPACIIPYGKASKELDPEPMAITDGVQPSCELRPYREESFNSRIDWANCGCLDDPDAVDGAPGAIQVIAPRFQDEMCLAAARVIDQDIR